MKTADFKKSSFIGLGVKNRENLQFCLWKYLQSSSQCRKNSKWKKRIYSLTKGSVIKELKIIIETFTFSVYFSYFPVRSSSADRRDYSHWVKATIDTECIKYRPLPEEYFQDPIRILSFTNSFISYPLNWSISRVSFEKLGFGGLE